MIQTTPACTAPCSMREIRGNDRADELVQWGKEEGPYARLRALGVGEGESRFGAADSSRGSETRDEGLGSGVLHRGR